MYAQGINKTSGITATIQNKNMDVVDTSDVQHQPSIHTHLNVRVTRRGNLKNGHSRDTENVGHTGQRQTKQNTARQTKKD
jgi:hypothetical protein